MQKVAAYLLERTEGMNWPETRAAEVALLKAQIAAWLASKGAPKLEAKGVYKAVDGSHATFGIEEASHLDRTWWMMRLEEVTNAGRRFSTAVSVTSWASRVVVFATMEVGSEATTILPVEAEPRCPRIIRTLLALPGRWFHGASELRAVREIEGFELGEGIVAEIKSPQRTVPILVVSRGHNGLALPDIHSKLAHDLAGLANVVVMDSDAGWALTDALGKMLSCFAGGVRLYWPRLALTEDPQRHPLWTRQLLTAGDPAEISDSFRRYIRGVVMRAAALGAVRPSLIDDIRRSASQAVLDEMKAKATSLPDFVALAESYAAENQQIRNEVSSLTKQAEVLQVRIVALEEERAALLTRVENAEVQLKYKASEPQGLAPAAQPAEPEAEGPPPPGTARFYKKKHSAPTHDIMEIVADCGCDAWQGSHAADKARKGIAKLEGSSDWKSLHHCASCTGGGMWRVRW
jgi:hypothetical protein